MEAWTRSARALGKRARHARQEWVRASVAQESMVVDHHHAPVGPRPSGCGSTSRRAHFVARFQWTPMRSAIAGNWSR